MVRSLIALLPFCCAVCLWAQAQPSTPASPPEDSLVIVVPQLGDQPLPKDEVAKASTSAAKYEESGTEKKPLFVKVTSADRPTQDAREHAEDRANAAKVANATVFYAVIAFVQLLIVGIQCFQLSKTIKSGAEQGKTLTTMVTEAKNAAAHIERGASNIQLAADAVRENANMAREMIGEQLDMLAKQMRAYLQIDAGTALAQITATEFRFQARPLLVNNGLTQATSVRVRSRAEIVANPLPADFVFRDPYGMAEESWFVGPKQSITLPISAEILVPDDEIIGIKVGLGKLLYAWGVINYDDVNGGSHELKFCLNFIWVGETVVGSFMGGRCSST